MAEKHPKRVTAKNRYGKSIEKYYATLAEFEYQGTLQLSPGSMPPSLRPSR